MLEFMSWTSCMLSNWK